MLHRFAGLTGIIVGILFLMGASMVQKSDAPKATPADAAKAKKALQEVQDFIGVWKLEGTQKAGGKTEAWKEDVSWGWKFKGDDAWIAVSFGGGKGKYFSKGDLKYVVEKKKYQLTLTAADKSEQVFEGDLTKGALVLLREDAKTKDKYRLTLNTLADGIRFSVKYEKQDGGRGLFTSLHNMNGNKDGESFAGGAKKPECIVTGGAATIAVSFGGQTYYVCCSGCRDAFNETPEKFTKKK
jgi:YHS domain-containing protein